MFIILIILNLNKKAVIEQKHNELAETVNELKTKVETYSDKINELEERVHQLENVKSILTWLVLIN